MTLPLVEFPELVEHYTPFFESVFSEQALVQFQRYISVDQLQMIIAYLPSVFNNSRRAERSSLYMTAPCEV
jgi:hypothetical protein